MITFVGRMQVDYGDWTDQNAGRIGIMLSPLSIVSTDKGCSANVFLEVNYMSDGASVPQFLWWFLPPWGDRSTIAALGHDRACDALKAGNPFGDLKTRAKCDDFYRRVLIAAGTHPFKARLAWTGVRAYSIYEGLGFGRRNS